MYREIFGEILDPLGNPIAGTEVSFQLRDNLGSYNPQSQYPGETTTVTCDAQGAFTITLWANEEGLRNSEYLCSFIKVFFAFTLPPGETPISLSELRSRGVLNPLTLAPQQNERLTVLQAGQTEFTLSSAPTDPEKLSFFVNGVKTSYSIDYAVNGLTVNWLNTYELAPSDYVEVFYR